MSEPQYIAIRNWSKFQYYSGRRPAWIVNHVEILHDENYLSLTSHQRGILHGLWLEYCSARAHLPLSTRSLTRRLNIRVMRRDLDALNHAGFIEYLHAPRMQDAFPRARVDIDIDTDTEPKAVNKVRTEEQRPGENSQEQELSEEQVRDLERQLADSLGEPW